jgi:hypothetical protein
MLGEAAFVAILLPKKAFSARDVARDIISMVFVNRI